MAPSPGFPPVPAVRWRSLELEGFGCWTAPVRVGFPEGLGVLVAPNESGKSTIVAGLMAVLYGLRGGGEPDQFALARFQSWHGAARCRGAVELVALDGQRYRIERAFDRHHVRLLRLTADGPVPELTGSHNPGARRPNERYEDRLRELVGIPSREVFAATFCVTQPLPEMNEVDEDVQRLLSGAGAASYTAALRGLSDELGAITRGTADLGVGTANARRERRLEMVQSEIASLERRVSEGREAADGLQEAAADLSEAEERRAAAHDSLARARRRLDGVQTWQRVAARYRAQSQRRAHLRHAVQQARELESELRAHDAALRDSFPDCASALSEDDERLDRLASLEQECASLQEQCDALRPAYEEAVRTEKQCDASLEAEYGEVAGRPQLVRDLQELQELAPRAARVGPLREEMARLEAEAAESSGYEVLARPVPATVSRLWHQSRDLMRVWRRHEDARRDLARLDEELKDYALFEEADPDLLAWIREEPLSAAELTVRSEAETLARQAREAQVRAIDDELLLLSVEQADVASLEPDALVAAERKVGLLEESQRLVWEAEQQQYLALMRLASLVVAFLGGIASGGAVMWVMGAPLPLALLVLVALAAIAMFFVWHRYQVVLTRSELVPRRARLLAQITDTDRRLGKFAQASAFELGGLRQRRIEYVRRLQDLQKRREGQLEPVGATVSDEREKRLLPFTARYGCVSIALDKFEALRERRGRLAEEHALLCRQEWGAEAGAVEGTSLEDAGGGWREVGALARVLGADPRTIGELVAWIEGHSDRAWEDALVKADAWESRTSRLEDLHRSLAALGEAPEELEERVAALRARTDPFDESVDLDIIAELCQDAAALAQKRDDARARREALEPQLERVSERLQAVRDEVRPLRESLAPLVGEAEVAAARERLRCYAQARAARDARKQALEAVLAAEAAEDVERLRERADAAEDDAVGLRRELEDLRAQQPDLPEIDDHDAVSPDDLEAEVARLDAELSETGARCHQLAMQHARLQGQSPINIAGSELRLAELRDEDARLRWESEVLATAYRELRAAVDAYQSAHRERLEEAASRHFVRVTGSSGRRVRLDQAFRVAVFEADGTSVHPSQLSRGAQDQLYLSLRLAVADVVAGNLALPLLLDDPFLNCDEDRLQRFRDALERMSAARQVLLFSHRPELQGWGGEITLEVNR